MASLDTLLSAIRIHLIAEHDAAVFPRQMLEAGLAALDLVDPEHDYSENAPLPSSRWLKDALARGFEAGDPLSEALRPCWKQMRWVTNGNYEGRPEMQNYLRNAAYCEIVGSRGLVERKDVSTGFFYIGPNVNYPAHDHPSPEAYWVLSGSAEWWRDDADWEVRPPGSRIYHAPLVPHAMRTSKEPLLTFFVWTGDVANLARVTENHPANKPN